MKITIKFKEKRRFSLSFWLPLSLVKTRLFKKYLIPEMINSSDDYDEEELLEETISDNETLVIKEKYNKKEIEEYYQAKIKPFYRYLKKYIKKYGHFTLVEVESEDVNVIIKI